MVAKAWNQIKTLAPVPLSEFRGREIVLLKSLLLDFIIFLNLQKQQLESAVN